MSAEAQFSLLLGYTAAQRKRWLAHKRRSKAAQSCLDLYVALTAAQVRTAKDLGMRCFGTPDEMAGMTFFFSRGDDPKPNAAKLLPKGFTLARVGLTWPATFQVFGTFETWKTRFVSLTVTREQARRITDGLVSNVQLLTARGWK